jgi:hypothetical protein
MFAGIMEKVKAFFGGLVSMFWGLVSKLMAIPKKALCWLHSKFCGC